MGEQEIELEQENIIITAGGAVNSVNGYTGDVVLTTSDLENTSDYQTGTEVESAISTAIAGKQDTLTAGSNITISNNTISATDTTYSAGTGLDLTGTTFSVDTATIATQQDVSNEATARENADTNLQGQIDAISASSDVKDIVGTKAELNNYDTSTLGNNDIIKVLQDESENDATTYYRWNATTQQFALIGEEGPYYTKSQADTLLNAKQNTLTAGSNVQIVNDTISATDTTYTDFTGTDGTTAGAAGLVPAPATTDAGKFLKADGTWDTVQGGGSYTAGDGIDITNDVISATNTGKARILTTADYNYPTDNPTGVALWLLEPGTYTMDGALVLYKSIGNTLDSNFTTFIIGNRRSDDIPMMAFRRVAALGVPHIKYLALRYDGDTSAEINILDNYFIVNDLTSTSTSKVLSAAQGKVLKDLVDSLAIRGAGAPTTSTVGQVGTLYEDTTNGDLYICTDATNPYVWEALGGGGGPTVVQTTGTSTTDVMSQNAVTSMVFADPARKRKIRLGEGTTGSDYSIGIGDYANTGSGTGATAIGQSSAAFTQDSIAIGTGAVARDRGGSIALGAYSGGNGIFTASGMIHIGSSQTSYGYNNSNYRLLTGLYDGQSAHDAATVGQITPTTDSSAPTTATAGRLGEIRIDTTTNTAYMCVLSDSTTPAYEWKQITS